MDKLIVCVGMYGETMWGNSDPAAQGIDVYASYDKFCDMVEAELRKLYPDVPTITVEYDEDETGDDAIIDDEQDADADMIETIADVTNRVHGTFGWTVYLPDWDQKEQDFWGDPQTVNLYEGNAGDLYIGQEWGPWFRMDNSAGKTTFAEDAQGYATGEGEWEPADESHSISPVLEGCKIVAEHRDGRTRYTGNAYTTSAPPGLTARAYVGPDAEGYEQE